MTQAILSICIPTYNREFYLKRLLDSLLPQIIECSGQVNLFITDNASSDGTQLLCQSYIESGSNLNYIRNTENIGPDANIAQAFDLADAEYAWVLGDDEFVHPKALIYILELLSKEKLSLLFLKNQPFNPANINEVKSIECKVYKNNLDFSNFIGVNFTFISGFVFNKKELMFKVPNFSYQGGLNSCLVQLTWVFSLLKVGTCFASTNIVILSAEANNSGGYKLYTVFGTNLANITERYFYDFPLIKDTICISAMWFLSVFTYKEHELFLSESNFSVMDSAFSKYKRYTFFVKPLRYVNYNISWFLFRVFYKINRIVVLCL